MAVSMTDVALRAGVSQRTVSNVVNDYVHVAPETRAKVLAAIDELGYRPNAVARRLRSGRTSTVTLALPSLSERYFADLAEAVVAEAERRGLKVLVELTHSDRRNELSLLRGGDLLTDGVIMSSVALTADDDHVRHPEYPLVLVGDRALQSDIDYVGADNRLAARAAVTHLLELGRRRIALVGDEHGPDRTLALRRQGYREALEEFGVPFDPELLIPCEWSRGLGEAAMTGFLATHAPPDGVFAMNDSSALGVLRACFVAGIRVPDELAVVGFDDIEEARYSVPPLSSVGPSNAEIAATALDLLAAQDGRAPDRRAEQVRPLFTLHVRGSTVPEA